MSETERRSARFDFTNTGGQTLVIEQIKTSCGCTTASLAKREYQPGEYGSFDVTLEPTAPGKEPKIVNVISNAQPDSFVRLILNADVRAFLDIQPRMLEIGVLAYRDEHHFTVSVSCPPDPNFTVEAVTTSNPHVSAVVQPPTPGSAARTIAVTVSPDAPWGGLFSWLEITGRGKPGLDAAPISHTSKIRIQGQIFGQLKAEPDAFRFGVKPGESFERRVRLSRPGGEAFTVVAVRVAESDLPGVTITVQKIVDNQYDLVMTATGDKIRPRADGIIAITTNVPGEELLDIPILGVVRSEPGGVR